MVLFHKISFHPHRLYLRENLLQVLKHLEAAPINIRPKSHDRIYLKVPCEY